MRILLAVGSLLTMAASFALADEFGAIVEKIDGDTITFRKRTAPSGAQPKGEVLTLSAKDAKVVKGTFERKTRKVEAGDPLEGGLKNEAFKVGAFVLVVRDADGKKVTEIRVTPPRLK